MKCPSDVLLLFFILIYTSNTIQRSNGVMVDEIYDVITLTKDVVETFAKTWKTADQHVNFSEVAKPVFDKTRAMLFGRIANITLKFDQIDDEVETLGTSTMAIVLRTIPNRIRLELHLNDLLDYMTRMDVDYKNFQNYVTNYKNLERLTLEDFAKHVISQESNSVVYLLQRIHALVTPNGGGITDTGLIKLLENTLKATDREVLCSYQQSPQQIISHLYDTILLSELKGYTMIQFAYMLLRLYDQGHFIMEAQLMRERFEQRTNDAIETLGKVMDNTSRKLWVCDPKKHEKGETYEEITRLLQGFIQNEVNLNSKDSCTYGCPEFQNVVHGCSGGDEDCWSQFRLLERTQNQCNGKVLHCQSFDSDMFFCPGSAGSNRRLNYVEFDNGRVLGKKEFCIGGAKRLESWKRYWMVECSFCFCLCDSETLDSDRHINLRISLADIDNNRVITGLRFVKKNRIIHLQIQEGKLLPRGKIDVDTVHWVPVENYNITNRKIYKDQDYHTLSYEKRAIDLDDLEAEEGYVLTGVRFKMIGPHLNFEILVSPFDFETGKLIDPFYKSKWKDNDKAYTPPFLPRSEVKLNRPGIPTTSPTASDLFSRSSQYVRFVNTDLDKDAGQTTVPFLDVQKVESLQPVPLSGAGIFHKGIYNSGGFIAPKIITYDFSKHLKPVFPEKKSTRHA